MGLSAHENEARFCWVLDGLLADGEPLGGVLDLGRLRVMRLALAQGRPGQDPGLFFRAATLALWLRSLKDFKPSQAH